MSTWLLTATPVLVLLLVAAAELLQSFQTRHLPLLAAGELARQQPAMQLPGQFLRYWPRAILGLGLVVMLARVNRMLDTTGTVRALLGLVLLWLLVAIVMEIGFGLTYRVVRGSGQPAGTREQYRFGTAVQRCGWYRLLLWLVACGLMLFWVQAN
ncbi:MAG: hypothetical protein KDE09_09740 [Anaerolineales bacterium]|nr:hypothetical protein [Anaerolineales bacterium]